MSLDETIYRAMKGSTWERAKGELRALVAIAGSVQTPLGAVRPERFPYQDLEDVVEAFIEKVEGDGLHE